MTEKTLHIYTRVSTRTQERDGVSLDEQQKAGRALAKKLGLKVVIHNEGGKSSNHEEIDKRPVLSTLIYKCSIGEVRNLYAWDFDRLSRTDWAQAIIRKHLRDNDISLYQGTSTNPSVLSDPKDDLFLQIQSAFAQYENAQRVARSRMGKIARTKEGRWHGGPPIYGFEIKDGKLSEDKKESKVVNRIFDLYNSGASLSEIGDELFRKNIPTRRGKASWSDRTLQLILTENSHYSGSYVVSFEGEKPIRVECPQIVSGDKILKAKEQHKKRSRSQGGRQARAPKQKTTFLLRDLLNCGHCGARYGAQNQQGRRIAHYYCVHSQHRYRKRDDIVQCDSPRNSIDIELTDNGVINAVVETLRDSHLFREQIKQEVLGSQKSLKQTQAQVLSQKRKIKKIKDDISKAKENLLNLNLDGLLGVSDSKDIKKVYQRLEDFRHQKEVELTGEQNRLKGLHQAEGWLDWVKQFGDRLDDLKWKKVEEKKAFIEGIVDSVSVRFSDKHTCHLKITLLYPYVGDSLVYKDSQNKRKGYSIKEGGRNQEVSLAIIEKQRGRPKKTQLGGGNGTKD